MFSEGVLLEPDTQFLTRTCFPYRHISLQNVENSGKNLFMHAQVGNKNAHGIFHGKLQAKGGQMSPSG